jgi:hypothetical protein
LNLDVDYVITGVAQAALEIIEAVREGKPLMQVGPEDQQLLAQWHRCAAGDQKLLMGLLKRLSKDAAPLDESGRYKTREESADHALHERRKKAL